MPDKEPVWIGHGVTDAPHAIVSMCVHQERIFVATERQVFELVDGVFRPLSFVEAKAA